MKMFRAEMQQPGRHRGETDAYLSREQVTDDLSRGFQLGKIINRPLVFHLLMTAVNDVCAAGRPLRFNLSFRPHIQSDGRPDENETVGRCRGRETEKKKIKGRNSCGIF